MTELMSFATETTPRSPLKAEAKEEAPCIGLVEGPEDHEFRRFMDQREQKRKKMRLAQTSNWWENDPPTPKQLAYLRYLGHRDVIKTKGEAARIIGELVAAKKY